MRKSITNLSLLLLCALVFEGRCEAQATTQEEPQVFPIINGSERDRLPPKITARGTVTQVSYAPPSCGELIFPATFEIRLDGEVKGYPHRFLYLVVPCLYQPAGAEKFLNQHIEVVAAKPTENYQPCFVDMKTSPIDSKGLPFYCAKREALLKAVMNEPVAEAKEPFEFTGTLEVGRTYRAQVIFDQAQEWRPVAPLKVPYHHAGRIEWLNLKDFPALNVPQSGTPLKYFTFQVEQKRIVRVAGQNRWNVTFECRITAVK